MTIKQVTKREVAMATLRADDDNGDASVHSIKCRKMDDTIGYKKRVSKSFRRLPGASKFRGNMNSGHELLFVNNDESDKEKKQFRLKIDLLIEVDGNITVRQSGKGRVGAQPTERPVYKENSDYAG